MALKLRQNCTIQVGLLLFAILCTGCLNTQNRKVVMEDDLKKEKIADKANNLVKKTYRELQAEEMNREKELQISEKLYREELYRESVRKKLTELEDEPTYDAFESYEADRSRVLNRKFADTRPGSAKE
ncbi:MAG: hypothetical protein P1V97_13825 [Planctomycetota bacterium]|nr:hypothetical protein [Planctomycetota bacterium]